MPRAKALSAYPQGFAKLLADATAYPVAVECESAHAASALRAQLYTFRRVARSEESRGLAQLYYSLEFSIQGSALEIRSKLDAPTTKPTRRPHPCPSDQPPATTT